MENTKNTIASAIAMFALGQLAKLRRESAADLVEAINSSHNAICMVGVAQRADFDSWKSLLIELSFEVVELEEAVENGSFAAAVMKKCATRFWQWVEQVDEHDQVYVCCDDVRLGMGKDVAMGRIVVTFRINYVSTHAV